MESVVIGGSPGLARLLKVTVLDVRAGRVRLGFEVDADIAVHRLEVWEGIRAAGGGNGSEAGPDSAVL
jgi:sRNA-binding carbon storage regulator CsrA